MSDNSHGFSNEKDISSYLNNRKFSELNTNMQNFLSFIFDQNISDDEIISSDTTKKVENKNPKPDIWIKINDNIKYISIKKGAGNSVHQESFSSFCSFLSNINISSDTINNLKIYHYGDDTLDGTGINRFSSDDVKTRYSQKIKSANAELNNQINLQKILNRILFEGVFKNPIVVDAFYHGTLEQGVYASRTEIIDYLTTKVDTTNMSCMQFSQLTYQPWTRDEHRTAAYPERRYTMQVKWGSMTKCIIKISKGRTTNVNK